MWVEDTLYNQKSGLELSCKQGLGVLVNYLPPNVMTLDIAGYCFLTARMSTAKSAKACSTDK